jgi:hypothetical protein
VTPPLRARRDSASWAGESRRAGDWRAQGGARRVQSDAWRAQRGAWRASCGAVCGARLAMLYVRGVVRTVCCVGCADRKRLRSGGGRRGCCLECNNSKGNRTPAEIGWNLKVLPKMPTGTVWSVRGSDRPLPQWSEFLALQKQAA